MAEAHATLSASGSAKWLACSGALALEALIGEPDTGNAYTREGTAAHELLYRSLSLDREPSAVLGKAITINKGEPDEQLIDVTQEMVNAVEIAIEYVERLQARNKFYEQQVDYSHIAPGGFGTADVLLEVYDKLAPGMRVNTLYVIDFKYGKGVKVEAFQNSQGMLYGLGSLNSLDPLFDMDIERVMIVIIQPRMDHIDEYEISVDDLKLWAIDEVKPKAEQAATLYDIVTGDPKIEIAPGAFNPTLKGCKWCQGRRLNKCKAVAQAGFSAAVEGFDDLTADEKNDLPSVEVKPETLHDPAFLDNGDLAAIYGRMSVFKSFLDALTDEIISRLKAGEDVPGLKLIPTQANRAWIGDDAATIKALRTAGLQKTHYEKIGLISPTEAEKLIKEVKPTSYKRRYKLLEKVAIHRPAGKDKIVEDNAPAGESDDLLAIDPNPLGFDLLS
jgi:hypothetical protein